MDTKTKSYQQVALENLANLEEYNDWLISKFEKFLGKSILEVGSGLGSISRNLKKRGFNITPTEFDPYFLNEIKKLDKNAMYLNILETNRLKKSFYTVLAINVIEHLKDDNKAFKNVHNLLAPKGNFIVLVPAHNFLYGSYDKQAGHYRRYSKKDLSIKLKNAGFSIRSIGYYNKLSAFGWLVNSRVLRRKNFPKFQLYLLKIVIPLLNFFDELIPVDFGLSVICIAKKLK